MRLALGCVMVGALLVGCNSEPEPPPMPELLPAAGTVKMDDKPLEGAVVMFLPTAENNSFSGMGVTNAEGKYDLKTRVGQEQHPGVPAGDYKVMVSRMVKPDGSVLPPDPSKPPAMSAAQQSIAMDYSMAGTTKLKASVAKGKDTFDFEVKPAAFMRGGPPKP